MSINTLNRVYFKKKAPEYLLIRKTGAKKLLLMSKISETWQEIENNYFYRYTVSSKGRVKNLDTNRILKIQVNNLGYCKAALLLHRTKTGWKVKCESVHRLVALAFVPNPANKKEVNHKDRNKENNDYKNLEWMTHAENMRHARTIGSFNTPKGEKSVRAKLTEAQVIRIKEVIRDGKTTLSEIARLHNVTTTCIVYIKSGKNWAHVR